MQINLQNASKFSIIAIRTFQDIGGEPIIYDNGLHVMSSMPTKVDKFWLANTGIIQAKEISKTNLILMAVSNQSEASVKDLERFLYRHYHGLLFQGVGYTNQGFNLSGDVNNNLLSIRSLSTRNFIFKRPPKITPKAYTIDKSHINKSVELAESISQIFQNDLDENNSNYLRLRKGYNAFLDGIEISEIRNLHKRLPLFVKALDAVFKTKRGSSEKQFSHRCKFLGGDNEEKRKIYNEIYQMRSSAEHLNPMSEVLNEYAENEIIDIKCLRTYQTELLAGHAYKKILSDSSLLENFNDDGSIDSFWRQQDHELKQTFESPIDFEKLAKTHFDSQVGGWY